MEEREARESENPPILKPSNKYKEDNPQAPDKSESKSYRKRGRKPASKKKRGHNGPASETNSKKSKVIHLANSVLFLPIF